MSRSACKWLGLYLALASVGSAAQTVAGSGTTNTVPVFTGTSTVGNSPITVSGGNVGIGTTQPIATLDVVGSSGTRRIFQEIYTNQPDYSYYYLTLFKIPTGTGWSATTLNAKVCVSRSNDIGVTQCAEIFASRDYYSNIYFSEVTPSVGYGGPFQFVTIANGGANWATLLYDTHLGPGPISWTIDGTLSNWNTTDVVSFTSISSASPKHSILSYSARNTSIPYGNVGIDTTTPAYPLDVAGQIRSSSGGIVFPDGTTQTTAYSASAAALDGAITQSNGNISVAGNIGSGGYLVSTNSGSVGPALSLVNPSKTAPGTARTWNIYNMTGGYGNSLQFWAYDTSGCSTGGLCASRMTLTDNGNVGIGTTSPGAKLEVDGNLKLTSGSGASITFADGTTQSTAYTGVVCGGDYAESVDVSGSRNNYEPGDVLVIGEEAGSDVVKSANPYSTLVVGVYSTKPGMVGRRQATDAKTSTTEVPMAMIGIVPTKVSAENGPIRRGDLLVTSSTVGYAMKGTDRSRLTGAVIGKALGTLDSGTGVIEVVVTLQ